jgi:hypothetical protein
MRGVIRLAVASVRSVETANSNGIAVSNNMVVLQVLSALTAQFSDKAKHLPPHRSQRDREATASMRREKSARERLDGCHAEPYSESSPSRHTFS